MAAVVLLVTVTTAGASEPGPSIDGRRQRSAAASGRDPRLPDPRPGKDALITGNAYLLQATHVPKAKVNIRLAAQLAVLYVAPNDSSQPYRALPLYTTYAARAQEPPCSRHVPFPSPSSTRVEPNLPQVNLITASVYAVRKLSAARDGHRARYAFGQFQPTKVSMLAFGAIPVTATVYLRQPVFAAGPRKGQYVPLNSSQYVPTANPTCDQTWTDEAPVLNIVRGQVDLRIGSIAVDGEPVDVGPNCHTSSLVKVNLWGNPGEYFPVQGGLLHQQRNTSRNSAGYENHPGSSDLTIPAFTGCRAAGGEELSNLLTGLISGAGNILAANQGNANLTLPNGIDPADPAACGSFNGQPECPVIPPDYPTLPTS